MTSSRRQDVRYPWLEPLLAIVCLWAGVQAVLVWWRTPPLPPELPSRIQLQRRWYQRTTTPPSLPQLPSGVVVRRAADYRASNGERLAMRWLVNESSGSGVRLEPEKLSTALLGRQTNVVCKVYDMSSGRLLGTASTGLDVKHLLSSQQPRGTDRLLWALGLRPWRENRCLFIGKLP